MAVRPGRHNRRVTLSRSPITTNDADGFLEALTPSDWWISIQPGPPGSADGRTRTSVVGMRFHEQVNEDTIITFYDEVLLRDRQLAVKGVQNVDEANVELVLLCEEVWP